VNPLFLFLSPFQGSSFWLCFLFGQPIWHFLCFSRLGCFLWIALSFPFNPPLRKPRLLGPGFESSLPTPKTSTPSPLSAPSPPQPPNRPRVSRPHSRPGPPPPHPLPPTPHPPPPPPPPPPLTPLFWASSLSLQLHPPGVTLPSVPSFLPLLHNFHAPRATNPLRTAPSSPPPLSFTNTFVTWQFPPVWLFFYPNALLWSTKVFEAKSSEAALLRRRTPFVLLSL